jgi:plastocyanin
VTLNNQDTLVPHDLTISGLAAIPSCTGPCSNSVAFTAPGPGNYPFLCTIHPDMTGTLRVAP